MRAVARAEPALRDGDGRRRLSAKPGGTAARGRAARRAEQEGAGEQMTHPVVTSPRERHAAEVSAHADDDEPLRVHHTL